MKFWAVVGNAATGKSSTIAGLGAITRRSPAWNMRMADGSTICCYVEIRSLQERKEEISAAEFVKEVRDRKGPKTTHVIVPLRYSNRARGDAEQYVEHFVRAASWECLGIVVLGTRDPKIFHPYDSGAFSITARVRDGSNELSRQLRARWGFA